MRYNKSITRIYKENIMTNSTLTVREQSLKELAIHLKSYPEFRRVAGGVPLIYLCTPVLSYKEDKQLRLTIDYSSDNNEYQSKLTHNDAKHSPIFNYTIRPSILHEEDIHQIALSLLQKVNKVGLELFFKEHQEKRAEEAKLEQPLVAEAQRQFDRLNELNLGENELNLGEIEYIEALNSIEQLIEEARLKKA